MDEEFYENSRRNLLLIHDLLSSLHNRIEKAKVSDNGETDSDLSKVGYQVRNAMNSLAEAIGVLEMWERMRVNDVGDFDPADPDDLLEEN